MASTWIETRKTASGTRYRVRYRLGGRESTPSLGGTFKTKREALLRSRWIEDELASLRVPDVRRLAETKEAPILAEIIPLWQRSRVDVRPATLVQHRVATQRLLPSLGGRRVNSITPKDVADLVGGMSADGYARESIRKTVTALAMVLDYAEIDPNPARDRKQVRLPREEPKEIEPPTAGQIEAICPLLKPEYLLALLVLDTTGARVTELTAATVRELDENRSGWLVTAAVSKTRKRRWVEVPPDLFNLLLMQLPPREDRAESMALFQGVTDDRLRMAVRRACTAAATAHFSPHDLRHRRISLFHHQGMSWAEIGRIVGQGSLRVTADIYTHALIDPREVDRHGFVTRLHDAFDRRPSRERAVRHGTGRAEHTPVHT